jgi:hypothetical protein
MSKEWVEELSLGIAEDDEFVCTYTEIEKLLNNGVDIIGLKKDNSFFIDYDYMRFENKYSYRLDFYVDGLYVLLGNNINTYLYKPFENKFIGKITGIEDLKIDYIKVVDDTLQVIYNIGEMPSSYEKITGKVFHKITDKGIISDKKMYMPDYFKKFRTVKLPVTRKYVVSILESLGYDIKPDRILRYRLLGNRLCVSYFAEGYMYYISDKMVLRMDKGNKFDCIYKEA